MFFEANNISKSYGGLHANQNVSLKVEEGQIVGLIGPNGAGKSTFFQTVQGFIKPDSGTIHFCGEELTGKPVNYISKKGIASTFQHAQLFAELTALESVMIGAYSRTKKRREARAEALRLLEFAGLAEIQGSVINKVNMYDRKVLELIAALATKPKLLLLDELFAGLTPNEVTEMVELVARINKEFGIAMLIVEHVLKVITSICEMVYVLNFGQIIMSCSPEELWSHEHVVAAYLGEEDSDDAS